MNYSYLLLTLIMTFCYLNCSSQDFIFLGEIRFDEEKFNIPTNLRGDLPYESFDKCYELKLFIRDETKVGKKGKKLEDVKTMSKEFYYDTITRKKVEVRIPLYKKDFGSRTELSVFGSFKPRGNTGIKKGFDTNIVHLKIPIENDDNWINNRTFKMTSAIKIEAPEEVSIVVLMDYVNNQLYNSETRNSYDNFSQTIVLLENNLPLNENLDQDQLKYCYRLLHFLEPFVLENTFMRSEALSLANKILSWSDSTILNSDTLKTIPEDFENEEEAKRKYSIEVYEKYKRFHFKIKRYYDLLEMLIFDKTSRENGKMLGVIELQQKANIHNLSDSINSSLCDSLLIEELVIHNSGNKIVNIKASTICDLDSLRKTIIYVNRVPIPYLKGEKLRQLLAKTRLYSITDKQDSYILLGEFVTFIVDSLESGTWEVEDDILFLNIDKRIVPIYEKLDINAFHLRIYSDYFGFQDNQPNGLLQFEGYKEISLNRQIDQIGNSSIHMSWLKHLVLKASLTKIENKNRFIPLVDSSPSNIDILKFSSSSTLIRLNMLTLGERNTNQILMFDIGLGGYLTGIDSSAFNLGPPFSIGSIFISMPASTLVIHPSSKLYFRLEHEVQFIQTLNREYRSSNSIFNSENLIQTVEAEFSVRISKRPCNFFTRFRYFWNQKNQNFAQFQAGLTVDLIFHPSGRGNYRRSIFMD